MARSPTPGVNASSRNRLGSTTHIRRDGKQIGAQPMLETVEFFTWLVRSHQWTPVELLLLAGALLVFAWAGLDLVAIASLRLRAWWRRRAMARLRSGGESGYSDPARPRARAHGDVDAAAHRVAVAPRLPDGAGRAPRAGARDDVQPPPAPVHLVRSGDGRNRVVLGPPFRQRVAPAAGGDRAPAAGASVETGSVNAQVIGRGGVA